VQQVHAKWAHDFAKVDVGSGILYMDNSARPRSASQVQSDAQTPPDKSVYTHQANTRVVLTDIT
jgi:hypothetical protein